MKLLLICSLLVIFFLIIKNLMQMSTKNILAINTDPEANMVTKVQYAVIADLHEVIPALIAEVKLRREGQSKI